MILSVKSQQFLIWWSVLFLAIFGYAFSQLIHMCPPPPATMSAVDVAAYYTAHASSMLVGTKLAAWASGFMLPFSVVVTAQMIRAEGGWSVWSLMQVLGGIMMSIFLVLPPDIWGAAAFHADRLPDATAALNDLANVTMVTTDQYYMFQTLAVVVMCFKGPHTADSAFPRWLGYVSAWCGLVFEVGPLGFLFKTGIWAWNGIGVFWFPLIFFGVWLVAMMFSVLRALSKQTDSRVP